MRRYQLGNSGEGVREIQERLSALGHSCDQDRPGEFGEATLAAVKAFQRTRSLPTTGVVGQESWRALYEAGYRLGDRLLFLRRPMLRGDDVAELQGRLDALGFDTGKPDGIFGPQTERGLRDFQFNRGLAIDGISGPEVITELQLVARGEMRAGRVTLREREWLRSRPSNLVGARIYFDPACRTQEEASVSWEAATAASIALQQGGGTPILSRGVDSTFPERVRARRANRMGADLIISFQLSGRPTGVISYFATSQSHSVAGKLIASCLAKAMDLEVAGQATAILKDTRSPAVVIAVPDLGATTGEAAVRGLQLFFETSIS